MYRDNIEKLFEDYKVKYNQCPLYADCTIKFKDDGSVFNVTIKLSSDLDEKDTEIFYYCDGIQDLIRLLDDETEDFTLLEVLRFYNDIY